MAFYMVSSITKKNVRKYFVFKVFKLLKTIYSDNNSTKRNFSMVLPKNNIENI